MINHNKNHSSRLTFTPALTFPPLCVLDDVKVELFPPELAELEVKEAAAPPGLLLVSLCLPAGGLAGHSSPCTSSTQMGCLELRTLGALGLQEGWKNSVALNQIRKTRKKILWSFSCRSCFSLINTNVLWVKSKHPSALMWRNATARQEDWYLPLLDSSHRLQWKKDVMLIFTVNVFITWLSSSAPSGLCGGADLFHGNKTSQHLTNWFPSYQSFTYSLSKDQFVSKDYFTHRDWEKSTWVFHSLVQTAGRLCPWNKQQNHVSVSVVSSLFRAPALVMFWIVLVSWRPCCIKHFHMWDTDEPKWTDWSVS